MIDMTGEMQELIDRAHADGWDCSAYESCEGCEGGDPASGDADGAEAGAVG